MTLNRIPILTPNYSPRNATVRLIVLHTSEGAQTYQSLGNFFINSANTSNPTSSHVGIDDTPNTIGEYVYHDYYSWTSSGANPVSIQAELCTPSGAAANWTSTIWTNDHSTMLSNTAAWIAEEAAHFSLPIVKLTPQQAQSNGRGVCQHSDLGSWGGGHYDCGNGFPIDHVIAMASGKPAPSPAPSPTPTPPSSKAPPFPYPSTDYLGQPSPDPHCHSGYYGGVDQANVATWQTQMRSRGWSISPDGMYGPNSESICRQFQQEKGLSVDGLVGPTTWSTSWTAPIT